MFFIRQGGTAAVADIAHAYGDSGLFVAFQDLSISAAVLWVSPQEPRQESAALETYGLL